MKTIRVSHSGDVGDFFYALSTIKTFGKVDIYFTYKRQLFVREPFTEEKVNSLLPILKKQSCINKVYFGEHKRCIDFDIWRENKVWRCSIPQAVEISFGILESTTKFAWIDCEEVSRIKYDYVFCRSLRYRNSDWMWKKLYQRYPNAIFIGLKDEYEDILKFCPNIKWVKTNNFYEVAKIMKNAKIVCVNQSANGALAQGLGCNTIMEVDRSFGNCKTDMPFAYYIEDNNAKRLDINKPEIFL